MDDEDSAVSDEMVKCLQELTSLWGDLRVTESIFRTWSDYNLDHLGLKKCGT
jgi:hypothetical protein